MLSERYGKACPICHVDWDVNQSHSLQTCCCRIICPECGDRLRASGVPCPLCQEPSAKSDEEEVARLRRHVENGIPEAMDTLGSKYYRVGDCGLKKSAKKAARLYERAVELGSVDAMVNLGVLLECGATGVKIDMKKAARLYRMAADRGDAVAQHNLGLISAKAGDFGEAARLFGLSAAQGFTNAQCSLGFCHYSGHGVPANRDEAKRLWRLAAAKGHEKAMRNLRDFMGEPFPPH